jgi:hypothetical protein
VESRTAHKAAGIFRAPTAATGIFFISFLLWVYKKPDGFYSRFL